MKQKLDWLGSEAIEMVSNRSSQTDLAHQNAVNPHLALNETRIQALASASRKAGAYEARTIEGGASWTETYNRDQSLW